MAAYCCWADRYPRRIISVGSLCTTRTGDEAGASPSADGSLGCDERMPGMRWGVAAALLPPSSASCSVFHDSNSASAAAIVGSSRLAGVAVLDRDLLVDLPKEPF